MSGEADIDRAIANLRELVPLLVIKRGARGATAFMGTQSWDAPAGVVQVVDAVGAGDSFNAGFLHGWIRGWPVERALAFGNRTGAWSASASGGTSAFRDGSALREHFSDWATGLEFATP
jgi:sugar/nucleoside kinase (ribokinase family)